MNKKLKQILSIFAAGTVAVTMGLSAFAAPVDEATIDRNRKASLSVYKYDITSAEKDGVWTTDGYQSTGVYDETGVNNILGNPDKPKVLPNGDTSYGYAVKGVEFIYKKVAEISTFSEKGTVSNLFGFEAEGTEETMLRAIGLSFADRETEADAVVNGKQMYYFTSDTRTYQDTMTQRIPLSQNKEFKTIKNAVIQEALNLLHNRITFEDEECEHPEMTMGDEAEEAKENISWTDPENINDQYCRAKSYPDEASEDFNSEELLQKAAMQGSTYAKYALAKMHLKGQAPYSSIAFAVQLLTEAADQGNQWAEYQLGKMYLYGQGVYMNYDLAVRLLSSSANKGNEYAQRLLENEFTYSQNNFAMALVSLRLFARIAQILQEDILKNDDIHSRIEKKVRRRIEEKKMAQGIKPE